MTWCPPGWGIERWVEGRVQCVPCDSVPYSGTERCTKGGVQCVPSDAAHHPLNEHYVGRDTSTPEDAA